MSALMDQVYESEAAALPTVTYPHLPASSPVADLRVRRVEAALVITASLTIAGLVFGFALSRFGWTGMLIATWPAFALAGGFGCFCHDIARPTRPPMSKPDRQAPS